MSKDLEVMKPVIAGALAGGDMDRHAIMTLALRHGFTLRPQEGRPDDLNEYVYSFAREVFEDGRKVGEKDRDALTSELERLRAQDSADAALISAAEAVIARWDSPGWKDLPPTADSIAVLRKAVLEAKAGRRVEPVNARLVEALKKQISNNEQAAFEEWLSSESSSGDVESVQRQWEESSAFRVFLELTAEARAALAAAEAQQAEPVRLTDEDFESLAREIMATAPDLTTPESLGMYSLRYIEAAALRANGLLPAEEQAAKSGE